MGGSYATVALNVGAAVGPALGAVVLTGSSNLGPVWGATALTALALLAMLPSLDLIAPRGGSVEAAK